MGERIMFDRERMQMLEKLLSGSGTRTAMAKFQRFAQLATDFATTVIALNTAGEETKDMISATRERLQMERSLTASRAAELAQTANDPSRGDTVRRVAARELSKLQEQRIAATPEEQEAFAELIEQQKTALQDLSTIEKAMRETVKTVKDSIEEIRLAVLGYDNNHRRSFVSGYEKEFAKLCEEVPVYDQAGI